MKRIQNVSIDVQKNQLRMKMESNQNKWKRSSDPQNQSMDLKNNELRIEIESNQKIYKDVLTSQKDYM